MVHRQLDIIIPVKDRTTVLRCVSTLLEKIALCEEIFLGQIVLCDGGSQLAACQSQLQRAAQLPQVRVLACPHAGFNKSWLMNQGLAAATAPLTLMSDVDILWNEAALSSLGIAAAGHPEWLYAVKTVQESERGSAATQRPRYTYCLEQTPTGSAVEVYLASPGSTSRRPGCGLLCAQKSLFQQIGGYRHCFQGWGWEDQDLLMRSQLLGYAIAELGTVIHLSHGDDQRNLKNRQFTPVQSRDRNIMRCLDGLAQGQLIGDLCQFEPDVRDHSAQFSCPPITVHYPPTLAHATHPDHPLPESSASSR